MGGELLEYECTPTEGEEETLTRKNLKRAEKGDAEIKTYWKKKLEELIWKFYFMVLLAKFSNL